MNGHAWSGRAQVGLNKRTVVFAESFPLYMGGVGTIRGTDPANNKTQRRFRSASTWARGARRSVQPRSYIIGPSKRQQTQRHTLRLTASPWNNSSYHIRHRASVVTSNRPHVRIIFCAMPRARPDSSCPRVLERVAIFQAFLCVGLRTTVLCSPTRHTTPRPQQCLPPPP